MNVMCNEQLAASNGRLALGEVGKFREGRGMRRVHRGRNANNS